MSLVLLPSLLSSSSLVLVCTQGWWLSPKTPGQTPSELGLEALKGRGSIALEERGCSLLDGPGQAPRETCSETEPWDGMFLPKGLRTRGGGDDDDSHHPQNVCCLHPVQATLGFDCLVVLELKGETFQPGGIIMVPLNWKHPATQPSGDLHFTLTQRRGMGRTQGPRGVPSTSLCQS